MRHYDTSCGPMSCVSTRKDGVPEFVIKALYYRAVCYSETISEITTFVISLMVYMSRGFWSAEILVLRACCTTIFFLSNEIFFELFA